MSDFSLVNPEMKTLIPTWRRLRRYGESRVIKSSYFWVVFVPIAAKLTPQIEKILSSLGNTITLSLPFSWQMFYFGSIFFAISSWIYSTKCPYLIQKYRTPIDYWVAGHTMREIDEYAVETFLDIDGWSQRELLDEYNQIKVTTDRHVHKDDEDTRNSKFHFIQKTTQYKRVYWRFFCTSGYIIGAIFFMIVLIQNFYFVLNQTIEF